MDLGKTIWFFICLKKHMEINKYILIMHVYVWNFKSNIISVD